jgi:polyisoprenoid-binding protein YceI
MLRLAVLLALCLPVAATAATWRIDPETRVAVDVTWQGTTVEVRFTRLSGTIEFDERRIETARARITVSARDVATGLGLIDDLVRSPGYLDAARHPTIVFDLDRLVRTSPQSADVFGSITMRGVTRPTVLSARVLRFGPADGAPQRFEAGFDIEGEIDRTEFGSTGGLPEVPPELKLRMRLVMSST